MAGNCNKGGILKKWRTTAKRRDTEKKWRKNCYKCRILKNGGKLQKGGILEKMAGNHKQTILSNSHIHTYIRGVLFFSYMLRIQKYNVKTCDWKANTLDQQTMLEEWRSLHNVMRSLYIYYIGPEQRLTEYL
jgi:hypothetical protein